MLEAPVQNSALPNEQTTPSDPFCASVGTRELITLDGLSVPLQGTYHRAPGQKPGVRDRVGVLFVNSLSLPRAASGDSAVYWADAMAAQGYPSFRIDLPGLGDSAGRSDTGLLDFINAGGYAGVVTIAMKQLVQRFNLVGVVLFGHCAGSVTALYASTGTSECKGLILLDPYFHLPEAKRPEMREKLSAWARSSALGKALSNVYDRVRSLKLSARGGALPANANAPLLARWKQIAEARMPVLVLKAPGIKAQGSKPRLGEFDYIDYIARVAGKKSRVAIQFIQDADHSFANRTGRDAVESHIEQWLDGNYPIPHFESSAVEHALQRGDDEADAGKQQANPVNRYCALES